MPHVTGHPGQKDTDQKDTHHGLNDEDIIDRIPLRSRSANSCLMARSIHQGLSLARTRTASICVSFHSLFQSRGIKTAGDFDNQFAMISVAWAEIEPLVGDALSQEYVPTAFSWIMRRYSQRLLQMTSARIFD